MKIRKNKRGIKIKKGCISCKYKKIDRLGRRTCRLQSTIEEGYCRKWRMTDALRNAGNPFGAIKSKEYLRFVLGIRESEMNGSWRVNIAPQREVAEIRKEYLDRHKDIRTDF